MYSGDQHCSWHATSSIQLVQPMPNTAVHGEQCTTTSRTVGEVSASVSTECSSNRHEYVPFPVSTKTTPGDKLHSLLLCMLYICMCLCISPSLSLSHTHTSVLQQHKHINIFTTNTPHTSKSKSSIEESKLQRVGRSMRGAVMRLLKVLLGPRCQY